MSTHKHVGQYYPIYVASHTVMHWKMHTSMLEELFTHPQQVLNGLIVF